MGLDPNKEGRPFPSNQGKLKFIVGLPILSYVLLVVGMSWVTRDMWDGVILAYGLQVGDLSGWREGIDESGWEIIPPLVYFFDWLGSLFFDGNYFSGYKALAVIVIALILRETYLFLRSGLALPAHWAAIGSSVVISNAAWTAASGSAMIFHIMAPALALWGTRSIYSGRTAIFRALGFGAVFFSFFLNSMVLFVPILSTIYEKSRIGWNSGEFLKIFLSAKLRLILLLATVFVPAQALLNPKFGRYSNYNQVPQALTGEGLANSTVALIWFLAAAIPMILVFASWAFVSHSYGSDKLSLVVSILTAPRVLLSLALCLGSMLPYVVVGKYPVFYAVWDWEGRHALALSITLGVMAAAVAFELVSRGLISVPVAIVPLVLVSIFGTAGQLTGFSLKYDRIEFDKALQSQLSTVLNETPPGYLYLDFYGGPLPTYSSRYDYDLQFQIYQATGKSHWLTSSFENYGTLPPPTIRSENDKLRDIYSGTEPNCASYLRVLGNGWGRPFISLAQKYFNVSTSPRVLVEREWSFCRD